MQVIYLDVLILINFSMDFVSLFLTARLMHTQAKVLPLAAAALIGAVYEAARVLISYSLPLSIISDAACAVLMCVVAFGAGELMRTTLTFCCAGIIIGGTMTAMYSLIGMEGGLFSEHRTSNTESGALQLPFGRYIPAIALSVAFAFLLCRALRSHLGKKRCSCRITVGGRSIEVSGLCDSGNLLCDPLSGRPCILLTPASGAVLLPPELCSGDYSPDSGSLSSALSRRIRVIPMQTPSGNALLTAVIPDSLSVCGRERSAVIAVAPGRDNFGGADALIPASLI